MKSAGSFPLRSHRYSNLNMSIHPIHSRTSQWWNHIFHPTSITYRILLSYPPIINLLRKYSTNCHHPACLSLLKGTMRSPNRFSKHINNE
jgi:hypothetical protein